LNFFDSPPPASSGAVPPFAAHWERVLEFVRVPSRFTGIDLQGNSPSFAGGSHVFQPPFNWISQYREPGRVNLNTIYAQDVWDGLNYGYPVGFDATVPTVTPFTWFTGSRQGYAGITWTAYNAVNDWSNLDARYPTRFARPLRSFAGLVNVPPTKNDPTSPADFEPTTVVGSEVQSGVLRKHPNNDNPLLNLTSADQALNTSRNPFFRYEGLQRLGNLATTRSNVYAVCITMGYFEVEPIEYEPADNSSLTFGLTAQEFKAIYGDGYQLAAELGLSTGDQRRHKAFYLIDRTIPVAFVRGQDLNVDKAIILKRHVN
jgi:hypothetical protein